MTPELAPYLPVCDAVALLFRPHAEVVLHDLGSQSVVHIAGNFSQRVLGEPSLLDEIGFDPDETIIGPYEKVNWDGRRLKSISIVLSAGAKAIGVLCINVDVSQFHALMQTLQAFATVPAGVEKPQALFKEDWHERINEFVQQWTQSRGLAVTSLSRAEKRELVADLAANGAFGGRNAAAYISRILGLARATVYNYLNQANETPRMLDLSRAEIEAAVDLDRAFIALEEGFKAAAAGQVQMPPVGYLGFPAHNGDCHIKFGHIAGDPIFVVKIATGFYDNPTKGLPTTSGMMIALSAETGAVVAMLRDEGWLTDLRTALAGAIATRAGMRADARRIGIVGAGTQARFQIRAAAHLLRDREPRFAVWARSPEKLGALQRDLEGEGITIEPVAELEALCAQSDALITVTPAAQPIIRDDWVRPGTHITALGADAPGKQELDSALVALADTRIADSLEQSLDHGEFAAAAAVGLIDAGDCVELGAVLAGDAPARHSDDDITIADLTGIAVQDIAIARVVLDGIGRQ